MEVLQQRAEPYIRPQKTPNGVYVFPNAHESSQHRVGSYLLVDSEATMRRLQEQLLNSGDIIADFLRAYELLQGMRGEALAGFELWNVCRRGRVWSPKIGQVGYPRFLGEIDGEHLSIKTSPDSSCFSVYIDGTVGAFGRRNPEDFREEMRKALRPVIANGISREREERDDIFLRISVPVEGEVEYMWDDTA